MSTCTPIFTLGSPRNGTTWLGNVLCRHPEVAGVQHEAHHGIHESKLWWHTKYWGDFSEEASFITFLEQYSAGDYFRLANGDKAHFYRERPRDFVAFFFRLMDRYASREGARYWVTKLDPMLYRRRGDRAAFLARVKQRYEHGLFVSIQRDPIAVLRSYLGMQGVASQRREAGFVAKGAAPLCIARNVVHYRGISEIVRSEGGLALSFDDFKNEHGASVQRVMQRLGLSAEVLGRERYPPNSSFDRKAQQDHSSAVRAAQRVWLPLFQRFPALAERVLALRDLMRRSTCPLSWRLLKKTYMEEALEEELLESGDYGLHATLFEKERGSKPR